jgi:hypothetical protein
MAAQPRVAVPYKHGLSRDPSRIVFDRNRSLAFSPFICYINVGFAAVGLSPVAAFGFYGVKSLGGPWAAQGPRLGLNGLCGLFSTEA